MKNESLHDAIRRKVREEVGLEAYVIMPIGVTEDFFEKGPMELKSGLHTLSIVYLLVADGDDVRLDDQSDDWGWFDQLPERLRKITAFTVSGGLLT
jgi:ADP-ribose pyrophosphatase YjhB (NUDIX family)